MSTLSTPKRVTDSLYMAKKNVVDTMKDLEKSCMVVPMSPTGSSKRVAGV